MITFFERCMQRRPILTQVLMTGFLFGTGDILAQQIVEKQGRNHDYLRTSRFAFFGSCMASPFMITWLHIINKIQAPSKNKQTFLRLGLDQLLWTPISISWFFAAQGILEGQNMAQIKERVKSSVPSALYYNYQIWPIVQYVNFRYVPHNYRLLLINVVALFWNCILSVLNKKADEHKLEIELSDKIKT